MDSVSRPSGSTSPGELRLSAAEAQALREERDQLRRDLGSLRASLEESRGLQRALLGATDFCALATDLDGVVHTLNRGAEQMLGYTSVESVGHMRLESLHLPAELRARAAELSLILNRPVEPGFETVVALAKEGRMDSREWTYLRKDGTQLTVRLSVDVIRDAEDRICGYLALAQDLTSRKRAEFALQASEQRLVQVLGKADCLVWEAQVDIGPVDWDWHFVVQPSAMHDRLLDGEPAGAGAGLWYRFDIPEQTEMNQRCRKAIESGLSGYEQEFRLIKENEVIWIHESVSITFAGPGRCWLVGVATDTTARRRAEEALRASEEQFRSAFDDAGIGMALIGLDGRWLRVNPAICAIVGFNEDELMKKTFQDITHPEDLDVDLSHVQDLLSGRARSYRLEKRYVHRDGHLVWIRLTASIVRRVTGEPSHFVSQIEDITPYKHAQAALAESEERARLFAEYAPASVAMFDREIRYMVCSNQWRTDYGLVGRDIVGRSHYEIFPEVPQRWKDVHLRCLAGAVEANEADPFDRADGTRMWLRWEVRPWFTAAKKIGGIVMFTANITELKRLQQELLERNAQLQVETARAQESNRMKSEFLANMSHELRTPLNGIIGFTSFLTEEKPGPLNARQKEYLQDVLKSSQHLLRLINDLLDLAKIESGKIDLTPEPFSTRAALDEVTSVLETMIQAKALRLETTVTLAPDAVVLDTQKFKQVLYNLLSNAIKFTPKAGRVSVGIDPVGEDEFVLKVSDSGIGIRKEDMAKLFVDFQQLDGGVAREYQGTGLGLALTKKFTQLQGGRITVESEFGQGTTFSVVLPRVYRVPAG